ncbi:hypothetical protein BaRGS_00013349 [Batillaria attramentaria]|uniref:Transposable element P transposase-like RNase H domain-containing protein n=1 Tax=Batillaria attramentaria TaxID=370345 RepID=A0ABD0L7V5_9CAEN
MSDLTHLFDIWHVAKGLAKKLDKLAKERNCAAVAPWKQSIIDNLPKAYRKLKQIFDLPSVRTLRRALESLAIYPGFSTNILQALSVKLESLPHGSEACAIIFDKMTIKETVTHDTKRDMLEGLVCLGHRGRRAHAASHALVFMVRGLRANW